MTSQAAWHGAANMYSISVRFLKHAAVDFQVQIFQKNGYKALVTISSLLGIAKFNIICRWID